MTNSKALVFLKSLPGNCAEVAGNVMLTCKSNRLFAILDSVMAVQGCYVTAKGAMFVAHTFRHGRPGPALLMIAAMGLEGIIIGGTIYGQNRHGNLIRLAQSMRRLHEMQPISNRYVM